MRISPVGMISVHLSLTSFYIGFARSIVVVLDHGNVIDSIVNSLAIIVGHLPESVQVLGMYVFQNVMNVFITSGSGMAATTMPIMVPLSDLLGITRGRPQSLHSSWEMDFRI
ncbi:hypothetical protein [Paenibacillus peoriae]|uniref:hypothetical protein n=1 Tax=Paenibacillus peoriae TaxID=59893 RepID=UPI0021DF5432|nr:hypothetical protein [Paenibacillus peoriae]